MTFKIEISQFYDKSESKQWKWNKNRHFSMGFLQIQQTPYLFCENILKLFQWLSKSKSHSFMTEVNTNNGNETKSNIFPWGIFKSATISFHISNFTYFAHSFYIKISQWLSKLKFFIFLSTVNSNNGNQTKSDIFSWDILRSDIVFHWLQNTKICQWLLYLAIFSFIAKVNTNK